VRPRAARRHQEAERLLVPDGRGGREGDRLLAELVDDELTVRGHPRLIHGQPGPGNGHLRRSSGYVAARARSTIRAQSTPTGRVPNARPLSPASPDAPNAPAPP